MNCPTCNSRARRISVHSEDHFHYYECAECGWDDYDQQARLAERARILQDDELLNDDGYVDLDFNDLIDEDY